MMASLLLFNGRTMSAINVNLKEESDKNIILKTKMITDQILMKVIYNFALLFQLEDDIK